MELDGSLLEAEPAREEFQVEVAEDGVPGYLEDRVKDHEDGCRLAVATGQVVPDQDHGDAAGEADEDDAGSELRKVGKEDPGQGEHQRRPYKPVEKQG